MEQYQELDRHIQQATRFESGDDIAFRQSRLASVEQARAALAAATRIAESSAEVTRTSHEIKPALNELEYVTQVSGNIIAMRTAALLAAEQK